MEEPYGHDGWIIGDSSQCSPFGMGRNEFCGGGPYTSSGNLGTISGSDLGNITGTFKVRPYCTVWDVFAGGFHAYCGNANTNTNLRVTVINP